MLSPRHAALVGALAVALGALASGPAAAQNAPAGGPPAGAPPTLISGTVVEADGGQPLEAATVAVWTVRDTTLVTGTVTDERGRFAIPGLRPGAYTLRVSYIGYTSGAASVAIRPDAPRADAGTIRLAEDAEQLAEVQVEGERETMTVGIDRTVYNTKDQIASTGGNATDVLRNVPSVEVDADGKVSLRGNQNVAILINGRPAPVTGEFLANFLQAIPAGNVARVEVIPNPSARYEPDGMAGMLNLVLKERTEVGLNGTLGAGATSTGGYNGTASVNATRGPLAFAASYGYRRDLRAIEGLTDRTRFTDDALLLSQDEQNDVTNGSHLLNGSVDWTLSRQNTVTATGLLSRRWGRMRGDIANRFGAGETRDRTIAGDIAGWNGDASLAFRRTVEPQKNELTAEVRFNRSTNDDLQRFTETAYDAAGVEASAPFLQRDERDNANRELIGQLDVVRPVAGFKTEVGLKGTLRRLDDRLAAQSSVDGTLAADPARSLDFDYDERIAAGYAQASRQVGKVSFQGGVRTEFARTELTDVASGAATANDRLAFFPSAFLTYAPTPARQFKLTYSKRVNRQQLFMLSPVPFYVDRFNIRQGNPDLAPEYTHSFEAGFTAFGQGRTLTLTPFFRRTVDAWRPQIQYNAETNVTTQTMYNAATNDSYGAEAIGTLRPNPALNLMLNLSAYRVVTDASNVEANLTNRTFQATARGSASITARPGTDLQLTAFYRSPMRFEQFRASGMLMTDVSVRQRLMGDKATLGLRVSDPLGVAKAHYRGQIEALDVVQEGDRRWGARAAFLTFSYAFGQPARNQPQRRPRPQEQPQQQDGTGGFGF